MRHSSEIEQEIKELAPGITWPGKEMPFYVPADYFDQLAERISALKGPATEVIEGQPFTMPAGYFDRLPEQMLNRVKATAAEKNTSSGTVISLLWKRVIPYAAAAMLGGVLVTGAFIFTDKRSVLDQNRSAQLDVTAAHTVLSPDNDLYKDISRKMQTISDEEISRYLDENTTTDALDWQPEELN